MGWGRRGNRYFMPAVLLTLLENMKICCKIQVIIHPPSNDYKRFRNKTNIVLKSEAITSKYLCLKRKGYRNNL